MSLLVNEVYANPSTPLWASVMSGGGKSIAGNNVPYNTDFSAVTAVTLNSVTFTPESAGTIVVMASGYFTNSSGTTQGTGVIIQLGDDAIGSLITCADASTVCSAPVYTRNVAGGSPITINLNASITGPTTPNIFVDATWTIMFFKSTA